MCFDACVHRLMSTKELPVVEGKAVDSLLRTTRSKEVADKLIELKLDAYEKEIIDVQGYDSLEAFEGMSKTELEDIAKTCKMKPGHAKKFVAAFADLDADATAKRDEKPGRTLSFYERSERRDADEKRANELAAARLAQQAPVQQVMQPAPNINVAGPNVVVQNTNVNKNTNTLNAAPVVFCCFDCFFMGGCIRSCCPCIACLCPRHVCCCF